MIEVREITDAETAQRAASLYGLTAGERCRVFCLEEGGIRGAAVLRLTETGVNIDDIRADDAALTDLLTRSVLNALANLKGIRVYATGARPELKIFGFEIRDNETQIRSEDITFPICHGRNV